MSAVGIRVLDHLPKKAERALPASHFARRSSNRAIHLGYADRLRLQLA